jgi:hypothetical protein
LLFIVVVLRKGDRLWLLAIDLYAQPVTGRCNTQVAVAEPAYQVEGFARGLLSGQAHGVVRNALLDRGPDLRSGAEESVRRHKPSQRLMRPLEVVCMNEKLDPSSTVGEVCKHCAREKLVP